MHNSPNLGQKTKSCPFWLKIGTYGILEVLILNPDLDLWNFDTKIHFEGKFGPKNSKLPILSENWYSWYLEDADSYSNISFLNFKSQFRFWANLGQKVKLVRFNWKLLDIFSNSNTKIHFWANLGRRSQTYLFFLKIGTRGILTMLILTWTLVFWICDPKSILGKFELKKSRLSSLAENWYLCVSKMLILIPALFFSVLNPKSIFGQIWVEKFKVGHFYWNLAHMVYRGCWLLFQQ